MYACMYDRTEVIQMILCKNPNIEIRNFNLRSAVMVSFYYKRANAALILIQHHAELYTHDVNRRSLLEYKCDSDCRKIQSHLICAIFGELKLYNPPEINNLIISYMLHP